MKLSSSQGMINTALGGIGYLICDGTVSQSSNSGDIVSKTPILCFHASPRNSDEFREVLPLLAATGRKVVAFDAPGYGISENPPHSVSIDEIADAYIVAASSLLLESDKQEQISSLKFLTIGNLMGCFLGVSLASRYPDQVLACIHANLYHFPTSNNDAASLNKHHKEQGQPIQDSFELKADGSHLLELHKKRPWLDPELNFRVVQGEMAYLIKRRERYAKGISIEDLSEFDFIAPARKIQCPTLCIKGEACLSFFDAIGYEGTKQFESGAALFPNSEIANMTGETSTLNMINQAPNEFASLCTAFLNKHGL
jgi:pimeloyl-ACP methyl ester carboxylesterase